MATRREFLKASVALVAWLLSGTRSEAQVSIPEPPAGDLPGHPWAFPLAFPAYFLADSGVTILEKKIKRVHLPIVING